MYSIIVHSWKRYYFHRPTHGDYGEGFSQINKGYQLNRRKALELDESVSTFIS